MAIKEIEQVGIVGCGVSGCAITQVVALAGYRVNVCEISQETLDQAFKKSLIFLKRQAIIGKINESEGRAVFSRVQGTLNLHDLKECQLIIEATPEDLVGKSEVMKQLDQICPKTTILAPHTSSLSVTKIAAATQRPERVVGLHFFHPIHIVKLVEVVQTMFVDRTILTFVFDFVKLLKKEPMIVHDSAGFIVNRLLIPYLFNAVRLLELGSATKEDIDKAMKIGCGYPIGPFALMDFMGLDHVRTIAENLYQEYQESQYLLPALVQRLIEEGHLGEKSGEGFYKYR